MSRVALQYSCLFMTLVGLLFLARVQRDLNGTKQMEIVADFWKAQVGREQAKRLLVMSQFAEFKQEVAVVLPEVSPTDAEKVPQSLRNLASLIPAERSQQGLLREPAERLLKMGKQSIREKDFGTGLKVLERLQREHPDSIHVVESHYLILEANHHLGNHAAVLKAAEKMVELFPDNPLTGYALLKAGQVYERDGRVEDAMDIYRSIVSTYPEPGLVIRAKSAAQKLEL